MRIPHTGVLLLVSTLACGVTRPPCTEQHIPVTVTNREGVPVPGLVKASFRAKLNGDAGVIVSVAPKSNPAMVLFLDASGSMVSQGKSQWKWFAAVKAAKAVVEAAPVDTPVALVVFAAKPAALEQGRSSVLKGLQLLETKPPDIRSKRTALLDSIMEGIRGIKPDFPDRIAYIFSDGGENVDTERKNKVRDRLIASKTRLFSFVIRDPTPRTPEEESGADLLGHLSSQTGGTSVVFPTASRDGEIKLARHQYSQIATFYELVLALPEPPTNSTRLKVEIVDAEGRRSREFKVHYPARVLPCSTIPSG